MMDDIHTIAARLAPEMPLQVRELDKGGNSRIYRVETAGGVYALKGYPIPNATDQRNRLDIEANALRFMHAHGLACIPSVVACDAAHQFSLLSWCEGEEIGTVNAQDIQSFADFLIRLADISRVAAAQNLPHASEACISGAIILSHIEKRLVKLQQAEDLREFIGDFFLPYLEKHTRLAKQAYAQAGISFDAELPRDLQVLIPSDFGTHNALRGKDTLLFLDFEYFGWDDPVTSTANFLLHPAMQLSAAHKLLFAGIMEQYFTPRDPLYAMRLEALLPLYAARFATIVLGEFIPAHWRHRVQCGKYRESEKAHVLAAQLCKAKAMIRSADTDTKNMTIS